MSKIDLTGFRGTEQYHKMEVFSGNLATDGIKEMAEQACAHWLATDILINHKYVESLINEPFITWKLKKEDKDSAMLIADDGNGKILHSQTYIVCDFPFEKVESNMSDESTFVMFFTNKILMLPSEY